LGKVSGKRTLTEGGRSNFPSCIRHGSTAFCDVLDRPDDLVGRVALLLSGQLDLAAHLSLAGIIAIPRSNCRVIPGTAHRDPI